MRKTRGVLSKLKWENSRRMWVVHLVKYCIPQKCSKIKPGTSQPELAKVQ